MWFVHDAFACCYVFDLLYALFCLRCVVHWCCRCGGARAVLCCVLMCGVCVVVFRWWLCDVVRCSV
jgi:hypothetical protein